jgi:hypothetical protein
MLVMSTGEESVKAVGIVAIGVTVFLGGCTTAGAPDTQTTDGDHGATRSYEIIDTGDLVLADAEEDWCNTLDQNTVRLLETVVSDGAAAISPDEFEDLDTFLRFPIPSPLACKTAFQERNK